MQLSDDPNLVKSKVWQPDLVKDWQHFQHKYEEPYAEAAWVDGKIYVRVYVPAKHWMGPVEPNFKVKHGMGFILDIRDMELLAPSAETPYRSCVGFRRCADGEDCSGEGQRTGG